MNDSLPPKRKRLFYGLLSAYVFLLFFFYWKYVPLIQDFQAVLLPVLVLTCVLAAVEAWRGMIAFLFFSLLINSLPYFFGIYENTPHAPTALVLFLFLWLGLLIHSRTNPAFWRDQYSHFLFRPLLLFVLIILVSAGISILRYANFFPFLSSGVYELKVNVLGVRAGGAIMSVVISSLNYITGILFFLALFALAKRKDFRSKLLVAFSLSTLLVLFFGLVQKFSAPGLGTTPFWRNLHQINATLKDPNSFGAVVSATFPLFLGLAFSFRPKYLRALFGILLLLSVLVFPSIGSRSNLLGLGVGLLCFGILFFIKSRFSHKKKLFAAGALILLAVLALGLTFFLSPGSILHQRMRSSLFWLEGKSSLHELFNKRLLFWKAGLDMFRDYPLTGVGVGSFIIELPNSLKKMGLPHQSTDSALNYVLQIGAELGIVGLAALAGIVGLIFQRARRQWQEISARDPDLYIFIGAVSGLAAFAANFVFQTFIGSFEVKYVLWFLVALALAVPSTEARPEPGKILQQRSAGHFKTAAILLVFIYGLLHSWNALHSLSLRSRTEEFSLRQDFGFYEWERDNAGRAFRWTKKTAGLTLDNPGPQLILPCLASHPDLEKNPVFLKVYLANAFFKKERLLRRISINQKGWRELTFSSREIPRKKAYLIFETSRTWRPLESLGQPDPRSLGVAIGKG